MDYSQSQHKFIKRSAELSVENSIKSNPQISNVFVTEHIIYDDTTILAIIFATVHNISNGLDVAS